MSPYINSNRTWGAAKRANKAAGKHFFDRDTVEFFNDQQHAPPNELGLFVHSICYDPHSEHEIHRQRKYLVAQIMPDGTVEEITSPTRDDWHRTAAEAIDYRDEITAKCLALQSDLDAVARRVAECSPADRDHFGNTYFVNGPEHQTPLGVSDLCEVWQSRMTKADGAAVSRGLHHKNALFAFEE